MSAIFVRCAVKKIDADVTSKNETILKRFWLLNSASKSDMLKDSIEVIKFEFSMKILLDWDVDEIDVNDDEIEMRKSSMSWDRWRTIAIWSIKSNDWISDEIFFERYNLRLTNSNEIVVFLKNSRKCLETKLDDKFAVFFNWIIVFRKSSRSITQFWDQIDFFANFSDRVLIAFEIRKNIVWLIMFEMKDLMSVKTRSENLCFVRKKSLSWKQNCRYSSTTDFFIKELKESSWNVREMIEIVKTINCRWFNSVCECDAKKKKKEVKMMKKKWASEINNETNSITKMTRSMNVDQHARLAFASSWLMSIMIDVKALMNNQKDCFDDRLMLSIVKIFSWKRLCDDESLNCSWRTLC
jgi:hypothetical protein